jgi:hypothetical protein
MKAAQFWNINNVSSFRGYGVVDGEISVSDSEYAEILNDVYGEVELCGCSYGAGDTLLGVDPTAFNCGKGDYESELQSELEGQLSCEDSDDIEFIEGDEFELDEEEQADE